MTTRIRTAAVLGAGTMGAQIAAHLANAGVPTLLLDVTREAARDGLERAKALKPDPFFTPATHTLIRTGGFDEDLAAVVAVRLDHRGRSSSGSTSSSRSSRGSSRIAARTRSSARTRRASRSRRWPRGAPTGFRRHFLGTHFFNPPRYLRLLEVIPTPDTDPAVVDAIVAFADRRLGKGVVIAKDTPNFIANHLGLYGVMQIFRALATGEYTIEEIDAMTGPAIGRPKSATFRTMDIAGIDVLAHVARNLAERLEIPEDRAMFALPPLVETMVERGWIGAKAGAGLLQEGCERRDPRRSIPTTMEYRPKQPARLPSLDAARSIEDVGERIRTLLNGQDKVGRFLRATLAPTLDYAERVAPAIAHEPGDVDRAMRWGFGWELGPVRSSMRHLGQAPAPARRSLGTGRRLRARPAKRGPQERRREPRRPRRRRARASSSTRR